MPFRPSPVIMKRLKSPADAAANTSTSAIPHAVASLLVLVDFTASSSWLARHTAAMIRKGTQRQKYWMYDGVGRREMAPSPTATWRARRLGAFATSVRLVDQTTKMMSIVI